VLITEIEDAIVSRLKAKIPDLLVESFPAKPSEFRLLHSKGAILVRYRGARYSAPETIGAVVQDRTMEFDVVIVTRNLRDHSGAYGYLDAVRLAMTGFQVPGCGKCYLTREEFIDETDGIWQHGVTVTMSAPNIEAADDELLPLLARVTLSDEHGTVEVTK